MRRLVILAFAFIVGCGGTNDQGGGSGGTGGTAGTGGSAGTGGTAGAGGTAGTGGTGGTGGSNLCDDIDCNDGNQCTEDVCNPNSGTCSNPTVQNGTQCNAGDFPGRCTDGLCVGLCVEVDCNDSNECTDDVCNRTDGSCDNTNRPNGSNCDFGGLPGRCDGGACVDAELCADVDCSDGNDCTDDVCNPANGGCSNPAKPDDSLCQIDSYPGLCASGTCQGLCEGVSCDDGNQCTLEQCDPNTGVCSNPPKPNGTTCDLDGLPGQCSSGLCVGLCSGVDCDDGNECTSDSCDTADGLCDHVAVAEGTTCAGGAAVCNGGRCTVTESVECDPGYGPINTSTYPAKSATTRTDENKYTVWDNYMSNVWTEQGSPIEGTITITRVRFCNPVGTPSCTDGTLPITEAKCWPIFPAAYSMPDVDGCVDVPLGTAGIDVYNVLVNTEQAPVVPCAVGTSNLHYSFGERTTTIDRRTGTAIVTYEVAPPVWSHLARDTCHRLDAACGVHWQQCANGFDDLSDEEKACTLESLELAEQYPATYCPAAIAGECPP